VRAVGRFEPAPVATSVQKIGMVSVRPERMRDHWWWRPGWRAGRRLYTWHLTFEGHHDLHRLVGTYQDCLDVPELDLVPLEGLHLTMQGVGFTDQLSQQQVRQIVVAAERRCGMLAPQDRACGSAHGPGGAAIDFPRPSPG